MKYCPKCGFETDDNECTCCPNCDEEVRLVERKRPATTSTSKPENADSESAGFKMGSGNAVGRDIVYTDNSKHEIKELSEAERIAKNKAAYREDCANRCKDGFVSDEDLDYLERQRESLSLEKHIAAEILKQAKERSIRKVVKLPDAARIQLDQTRIAIERNDIQAIRVDFDALKQWKSKLDIDELDQLYFQLKSILEPNAYEFKDNEYWSVFWSAVAFKKTGSPKVVESIASLNRWDSFYPQQNQNLILTVSLLMDNRLKEATESFKAITKGFSPDLQPVYDTLDSMLGREWRSLTIDVAPRLRFYSDSLFKNSYDVLKKTAQKNHAEDIARAEEERQRKEEEKNRREKFLEIFESNGGNIDAACFATGLPKVKYIEWLETIPEFAQSVKTVQERIAKAIKDQEEAAVDAERLAKEIANKKELFKKGYKDNQCDLNKTCYGLGIDSGTVRSWRSSDASFDEALKFIEREHEIAVEEERKRKKAIKRAEQRKEFFRKIRKSIPYVLISLLLIASGIGISKLVKNGQEKQTEIKNYNEQIEKFDSAIQLVNTSDPGLDALGNAAKIILTLKEQESKYDYLAARNASDSLTAIVQERADSLLVNFKRKKVRPEEFGGNEIMWKDGERGYNRVYEIMNSLK